MWASGWRRCAAEKAAPPAYAPVWAGTKNALRDSLGAFLIMGLTWMVAQREQRG